MYVTSSGKGQAVFTSPLYVCKHGSVYRYACSVCACGGQRSASVHLPQLLSALFFETSGWPVGSGGILSLPCWVEPLPTFDIGAGDPDSGPCAFMVSTLSTEPFPQPLHKHRTTVIMARRISVAPTFPHRRFKVCKSIYASIPSFYKCWSSFIIGNPLSRR